MLLPLAPARPAPGPIDSSAGSAMPAAQKATSTTQARVPRAPGAKPAARPGTPTARLPGSASRATSSSRTLPPEPPLGAVSMDSTSRPGPVLRALRTAGRAPPTQQTHAPRQTKGTI